MAKVYGRKLVNGAAARASETRAEIRRTTNRVDHRASRNLSQARATTQWDKIHGPGHLTTIGSFLEEIDGVVYMQAPDAMAIEFGHAPSGVFGPGGELGHIPTRAPAGLYILTRAAGLPGLNFVPAANRKIGKR